MGNSRPAENESTISPGSMAEAFDVPADPSTAHLPEPSGEVPTSAGPPEPVRKRRSTFSLKANLHPGAASGEVGEEAGGPALEPEVKRLGPFSQHALEAAWLDAVKKMEDRPVIHSVIAKTTPVLEDDFRVRISVENRVQSDYLEGVRDELVGDLRAMLENDALRLITVVEEGASNAKIVYTPEERFQFLLEKNPHLAEFRREFKLDLE